jgi:peptide/nickel transport system permease protein
MSSRSAALRYYVFTRLLLAPLMILTITTVVFLLLRATPGDQWMPCWGRGLRRRQRRAAGSAGPRPALFIQYLRYLGDLLRFDLGSSLATQAKRYGKLFGLTFRLR